jgi:hypothetical protein
MEPCRFTYESAGLLDRTHLRFFTQREIEKLFFRAGFSIDAMSSVVGPGDSNAVRDGLKRVRLGRLSIDGLSGMIARELSLTPSRHVSLCRLCGHPS